MSGDLCKLADAPQPRSHCIASDGKIVGRLKVEPMFRRLVERLAKQERQFGSDRARSANDEGHAHRRDADDAREFRLRDAELGEYLRKKLSRMDPSKSVLHGACSSVVIVDFNLKRITI